MQLGKIPPLHFTSVGMTCRGAVPFNRTGYNCHVAWRWIIAATLGGTVYWVIPFNRTGYNRNVAGGRLPPLRTRRLVIPFIRTGYIRGVSGTAHRPFPTVSLVGVFFNQRSPKTSDFCFFWFKLTTPVTPITVNCPLSTFQNCQLSIVHCQFSILPCAEQHSVAFHLEGFQQFFRGHGGTGFA